jgi:hypothetical protein
MISGMIEQNLEVGMPGPKAGGVDFVSMFERPPESIWRHRAVVDRRIPFPRDDPADVLDLEFRRRHRKDSTQDPL